MNTKLITAKNAIKVFADIGGVDQPPSIVIGSRQFRGCCYNSISHQIKISGDLLNQMSDDTLLAMIAHEVGHARQRKQIIKSVLHSIGILLGLSILAIALISTIIEKHKGAAFAIWIAWMIVFVWRINREEIAINISSRMRENDADDFAAKCTGGYQNMIDALIAHKIVYGNELGKEALARIARMEKLLVEH